MSPSDTLQGPKPVCKVPAVADGADFNYTSCRAKAAAEGSPNFGYAEMADPDKRCFLLRADWRDNAEVTLAGGGHATPDTACAQHGTETDGECSLRAGRVCKFGGSVRGHRPTSVDACYISVYSGTA